MEKKLSVILISLICNLSFFGQSVEDYNDFGNAKFEQRDYKGAIVEYSNAIELNPYHKYIQYAYFNRGMCRYALYDYRGAILDFNIAIDLNPNDGYAYGNRGNAKYEINDTNGACLDWNKASKLEVQQAKDCFQKYCN